MQRLAAKDNGTLAVETTKFAIKFFQAFRAVENAKLRDDVLAVGHGAARFGPLFLPLTTMPQCGMHMA